MMNEKRVIHRIGIIMTGVTGRMGSNQDLMRSIVEIIRQGGAAAGEDEFILPVPVLVGRNEEKLKKLADQSGIIQYTTDLRSVLDDPQYPVYFDAQTTSRRVDAIKMAIRAGKHIYCEKPVAASTNQAMELYRLAEHAGIKHGVVQDKLWLPG